MKKGNFTYKGIKIYFISVGKSSAVAFTKKQAENKFKRNK